jgi:hypothetical protein
MTKLVWNPVKHTIGYDFYSNIKGGQAWIFQSSAIFVARAIPSSRVID